MEPTQNPAVICGIHYSRCICELSPHESGSCRCECGGMWEIVGDHVRVRAMPQTIARGHPGEGEPNPMLVSEYPEWIGVEDLDIDGGPWPEPPPTPYPALFHAPRRHIQAFKLPPLLGY